MLQAEDKNVKNHQLKWMVWLWTGPRITVSSGSEHGNYFVMLTHNSRKSQKIMCSWDLMKKDTIPLVILKVGTVHLCKLDKWGYWLACFCKPLSDNNQLLGWIFYCLVENPVCWMIIPWVVSSLCLGWPSATTLSCTVPVNTNWDSRLWFAYSSSSKGKI